MKKKSYEELYAELESISAKLSDGKLPLNETVELYEQGMKLAKECKNRIDAYEKRVNALLDEAEEDEELDFEV